jgi:hypothetical protein
MRAVSKAQAGKDKRMLRMTRMLSLSTVILTSSTTLTWSQNNLAAALSAGLVSKKFTFDNTKSLGNWTITDGRIKKIQRHKSIRAQERISVPELFILTRLGIWGIVWWERC